MLASITVMALLAGPARAEAPAAAPATGPQLTDCAPMTDPAAKAACEKANQLATLNFQLAALKACVDLKDAALTECTAKKADLEKQIAALTNPPPAKGGKAVRSDTNHMEEEPTGAE